MLIAVKALIPAQNASWARKQPTPLVLSAFPALAVIERLVRNLPLYFGGEKKQEMEQGKVIQGRFQCRVVTCSCKSFLHCFPNPRFFRKNISGYSPGPARRVQTPVPQVREPPLLLSVTFFREVPPWCLTTAALPAASPRRVMLSPRCTTFPSIRRCRSQKQLSARELYLISATDLGLIKGILLGFRVAKGLKANRNYGTGVV